MVGNGVASHFAVNVHVFFYSVVKIQIFFLVLFWACFITGIIIQRVVQITNTSEKILFPKEINFLQRKVGPWLPVSTNQKVACWCAVRMILSMSYICVPPTCNKLTNRPTPNLLTNKQTHSKGEYTVSPMKRQKNRNKTERQKTMTLNDALFRRLLH